ncbi:hypothetical protein PR202_ga24900 [Eleusine coracana subsp. coracana]|uniref:Uncharacterized protein n=1 Tax=Eleusine coracana subsp. coracana TaxID=191504 RepID=A0AAV5DAA4_ELECO|nr:hypothetical protein QOZ80_9AG0673250 [Eleusine coracana subsp. coracana]GJN07103.1 hypothetical protein PR202_ga24900 [Eleusine coracana subsp. coracana]
MASAAFKSTTRRSLYAASPSDPPPCPRRSRSRSRSVSAAPRGRGVEEDYANTRTNPLFDTTASSSTSASPPPPAAATATSSRGGDAARRERERRGREPVKVGGRGGGGRARSVSVAPQGRRTGATSSAESAAAVGGRRSSRARSVTDGARPYRGSETDAESRSITVKLQSRRSQHSVLEEKHRGNGTHAGSSSQGSATEVAAFQHNHSDTTANPVLEIPPEFDPDSAEFVFDISDCATEYRNEDVADRSFDSDTDAVELASDIRHNSKDRGWEPVEIPLEFDPEAAELVSDMKHQDAKQQWEKMRIPLQFDPDTSGLTPDITEYTIKLKQSHERARKLRADLAVEEQREQELSRMLKDIVTDPNFSETHRKRPRRKSSIERLKVSRHLAEEAMNYFEECVSISTMDSTDFSLPDDPQSNSIVSAPPKNNSRFSHKGRTILQGSHTATDQHGHLEESDNQTQCSVSIIGSDMSDINAPGLKIRSNSSDDFDGFDTPRSRSSCFSFTHKPAKTIENCDIQQYLGKFGRGNNKDLKDMKSSYFADDYTFQKAKLDLLMDMVTFQSRIEYGGLVICNTRTF